MSAARRLMPPVIPSVVPSLRADSKQLPAVDASLEGRLQSMDFAFTISDPSLPDHPIVFASSKFYELTGYSEGEVLGRNCRFLQGPETERRKVTEMRDAIREHRPCQVCILNYKKNGQPFWNQFYLSPVCDGQGQLAHYVGIQADVTKVVEKYCAEEAVNNGNSIARTCPREPMAAALDLAEDGDYETAQQEGHAAATIGSILQTAPAAHITTPCLVQPALLPSSLLLPLLKIQQSYVLADPRLPDMPIVHASEQFLQLTEYPREQVVGRNCRFLQGPGTDPDEVAKLRDAVTASPPRPVTVRLLNYTASGRPFWNCLHVAPVRDSHGDVMFFVGIQLDISQGLPATVTGLAPATPITISQKMAHQGVTGTIRVAVRSLGGDLGLRRSIDHQVLPHSHSLSLASSYASSRHHSPTPSRIGAEGGAAMQRGSGAMSDTSFFANVLSLEQSASGLSQALGPAPSANSDTWQSGNNLAPMMESKEARVGTGGAAAGPIAAPGDSEQELGM